ncbi:MAG: hypothetical protein KJZ59_09670, partial [Pararhodobacter sp.]|nr:hypothetical protein [Pararhodobacter sp.]
MNTPIRAGFLRGIVMRAPGITATTEFYTELWGLKVARSGDGITYLRGTGAEPFIYGLKDGDTYGIEYVHFGMENRADMDALYDHVTARGAPALGKPALFDDPIGGYGFEILDPDNRRLRFTTDLEPNAAEDVFAYPRKVSHVVLNTPDMEGLEVWYQDV